MKVVTGAQMHQIDRYAIEEIGLNEEILMENAGQAFVQCLLPILDKKIARIAVLIGAGNNGGDGFVISRSLLEKGYLVDVWLIPPMQKVKGTAGYHMKIFLKCGYKLKEFADFETFSKQLHGYTHLIDALLGTGLKGSVRSPYKEIIEWINTLSSMIISVDVPSGLPSDELDEIVSVVRATKTFTLQNPKISAYMYPHREYYGELTIVDIGIPKKAIDHIANRRFLWTEDDMTRTLPVRKPSSHKGSHGKGLIIAGSSTMTGAPILTAKACHKLGAGLVTLAIPDVAQKNIASQLIEATFHLCSSHHGQIDQLNLSQEELTKRFDAIAVGPGIGRDHNGSFLEGLLTTFENPLVIDADGIFYLKKYLSTLTNRKGETIVTPHLGEFSYLVEKPIVEIEKNRFELSKQFAIKHGIYLVLKGPFTILTTPKGDQFINTSGNASLAKGGTGDVLTGMILALIMQQNDLQSAISNAIFLHGKAADFLLDQGWSSLSVLASDLLEVMPTVIGSVQNSYCR